MQCLDIGQKTGTLTHGIGTGVAGIDCKLSGGIIQ